MSKFGFREVEELVDLHRGIVNFGDESSSVGDDWVEKAEQALGAVFADSYKWFLKRYAGGEVGGEEVYSLYGMDFDTVNGGDIVFQHLVGLKNNTVDNSRLVISETDLGEVFFFDLNSYEGGEYSIKVRIPSGEFLNYAGNFYEFLCKRILAHI
ncbi:MULTISPECIES: SMI1/KNR4 family protein [Pseudomonadaceae]|uniref:SMI1/KNR4 family protein n=1 Tax=Pseudomonas denitrificans TaxID=43306 RepID=A0A9X7R6H7_PSEDE|nr:MULTISPECIES: SMI1/KNR4 family protein [Pseudomonadaceae]MBD9634380.1 SMI1/KNR4 family protein [Pseudomonas sp. PDM19]QEY74482.1 SMI1/KNR4 family protein [Pseudomonas denitrificans (nom. rej.)]